MELEHAEEYLPQDIRVDELPLAIRTRLLNNSTSFIVYKKSLAVRTRKRAFPAASRPLVSLPTLWHLCRWIDSMDANPGDPANRVMGGL